MQYQLCAFEAASGDKSGGLDCRPFLYRFIALCKFAHDDGVYFAFHTTAHACFNLLGQMPHYKTQQRYSCRGVTKCVYLQDFATQLQPVQN